MSAVEIRRCELPRDIVKFVKTWWPIYEGDEQWVPPLVFERKIFLNPAKNPYFKAAKVQLFMAYKDGKPVGTISAQVDQYYQSVEEGVGFFGFFEFIDDVEVARALKDAAFAWLAEQGMTRAMGPLNFNTNHEFGLLCDGFDTPPMVANPHNHAYYEGIYKQIGLENLKDWFAYWFDRAEPSERVKRIAERFMSRNPNITLRNADLKNFDREVAIFHDIYDDAWEDNWGHSRLSKEEFAFMGEGFKQLLDPKLAYVMELDGEPVALALSLPDYNQVVKKMNGSRFPFGWFHWVFGRKNIDQFRIFILGVKREHQRMPFGAPMYMKTWEEGMSRPQIKGAEASLIIEDNHRMRGALEKLGARIYKTYRIYGGSVTNDAE